MSPLRNGLFSRWRLLLAKSTLLWGPKSKITHPSSLWVRWLMVTANWVVIKKVGSSSVVFHGLQNKRKAIINHAALESAIPCLHYSFLMSFSRPWSRCRIQNNMLRSCITTVCRWKKLESRRVFLRRIFFLFRGHSERFLIALFLKNWKFYAIATFYNIITTSMPERVS